MSAPRASALFLNDDFPEFNTTYERLFATLPRPARTTTGAELRDILVEIDAVLYLPGG